MVYDLGEFKGELFRMNLSCVSKVTKSDCLFFKVAGKSILSKGVPIPKPSHACEFMHVHVLYVQQSLVVWCPEKFKHWRRPCYLAAL